MDPHLPGRFRREHDAAFGTGGVDRHAVGLARRRDDREVEQRGIEHRARRRVLELDAGLAREVDREERAEERRVRRASAELTGHDRDLDARRERAVVVTRGAELEPARTTHRLGEPLAAAVVVEVVDRLRTEVGDQGAGTPTQLQLLRRVPGVHD